MACPLCDGDSVALPVLPASMLSDGRVLHEPLRRRSCLSCGVGFAWPQPEAQTVTAWFEDGYALPERAPASDARRAAAYAEWIGPVAPGPPATVLDAGCGSGALLAALAARWPDARLTGFDPAVAQDGTGLAGARLLRGGEGRVAGEAFDLVVSVNAIEHTPDPRRFLASLAAAVAQGGMLVLVCPDGECVGAELLIADHLHSFSRDALLHLARSVGLEATQHDRRNGFQRLALSRGAAAELGSGTLDATALAGERAELLQSWVEFDARLSADLPASLPAFGAGEAAALLRAYAPDAWARTSLLMLDDPGDAWPLGRPVVAYRPAETPGAPILLAVSAASEPALARRLRADGWAPIGTASLLGDRTSA